MPALLAGLALSACVPSAPPETETAPQAESRQVEAATQSPAQSDPVVTASFGGTGFNWSRNGGLMLRFSAIERDGEVWICGSFTGRGSSNSRKLSREAMRQATVVSNGQVIMRNLRFFAEASNGNWESRLVGTETNCQSTGQSVGAVPLDSVSVEMRSGRYRVRT